VSQSYSVDGSSDAVCCCQYCRYLLAVGVGVPSLVAVSLCVVMLWRWRHDKPAVPPPVRRTFNRTFRRHTATTASVVFQREERTNNERNSAQQVRAVSLRSLEMAAIEIYQLCCSV